MIGRGSAGSGEIPRRPYRDSAILYAVLAVIIVVVALITGGSIGRALAYAIGFFVLATGWSFWRWRERIRAHERELRRREDWRAEQQARVSKGNESK